VSLPIASSPSRGYEEQMGASNVCVGLGTPRPHRAARRPPEHAPV